jgi:probable rRNA maturation factor
VEKEKNLKHNLNNCVITNLTKGNPPIGRLPFVSMKEAVLGKNYELSVVFASKGTLRKLNRIYRGNDKSTDILSFPLGKSEGEIFINGNEAKNEAKKFGRNFENFIGFLFIHGLVHLKGFAHGSTMETQETKFRTRFGI